MAENEQQQILFQVDAFSNKLFGGNPAGVCPLSIVSPGDEADKSAICWPSLDVMQSIALENNVAETAFLLPILKGDNKKESDCIFKTCKEYHIKWFTPTCEIDLCGHATLASAHVLFKEYSNINDSITFKSTNCGDLTVSRSTTRDGWLTLNFPVDDIKQINSNDSKYNDTKSKLSSALNCADSNVNIVEIYHGKTDLVVIVENQTQLLALKPNFKEINEQFPVERGVIVTSKADNNSNNNDSCDNICFVSRFFAPQSGIDEDPTTGSAHTSLTPIWYNKLYGGNDKKKEDDNKVYPEMMAKQLSKRIGTLCCQLTKGGRVNISGEAVTYFKGCIRLQL